MSYRWQIQELAPPDAVRDLAEQIDLSPQILSILYQRGYDSIASIDEFLTPDLSGGHDPFLMLGMDVAVDRIQGALDSGHKVRVHGDYDVDGVTASALLVRILHLIGIDTDAHIPHRTSDGYGLSLEAVEQAADDGINLIITVDCGISAISEVERAGELGIDVIVTDHHKPGSMVPDAVAVLNPHQDECSYPFPDLCGVGIAYKLACALNPPGTEPSLLEYLDLVALGTTADVVPLKGENRVFVKYGLPQLARTRWPGLKALIDRVGLKGDQVSAGDAVFSLAPRINAAGRMGDARDAFDLLITDNEFDGAELAMRLDSYNNERRLADRNTLLSAEDLLASEDAPGDRHSLVLCADDWHPGVIGIVASRLVERYRLPTVLVAMDGDEGRGSARSIEGFDLYSALDECAEHLVEFGGHPRAAGLCISRDNFKEFSKAFDNVARNELAEYDIEPTIKVDSEIQSEHLDASFLGELKLLEPFGFGNRRPTFMLRKARVLGSPKRVGGEGAHLKFMVDIQSGNGIDVIGFNMGDRIGDLEAGTIDLVFAFEENEFRGVRRAQIRMKDMRPATP
ncbi:single-stranded-DNA-specific exonuclease RecJ [Candidatus Zixiibacteriota bacterium]